MVEPAMRLQSLEVEYTLLLKLSLQAREAFLNNPECFISHTVSENLFLGLLIIVLRIKNLKDIPREVKETLLLPRKCPFASERHLCPQVMQK
jgi:hypothetical protein